jgi:hypothetical protein
VATDLVQERSNHRLSREPAQLLPHNGGEVLREITRRGALLQQLEQDGAADERHGSNNGTVPRGKLDKRCERPGNDRGLLAKEEAKLDELRSKRLPCRSLRRGLCSDLRKIKPDTAPTGYREGGGSIN